MFMKNLFPCKSRKYLITGVATLVILGFVVVGSQGPFLFGASHTANFCDSYHGSVQGVSNFKPACHQLVDSLDSNEKTLLQNATFVKQLQAYLKSTTPNSQVGHILVQLFPTPGNFNPSINAVPSWTLYGDGTIIFDSQAFDVQSLQQAQLTPTEINHILDVIVNQNDFFAESQSTYGEFIPDVGSTQLLVNANGQQKTVTLGEEPQNASDVQTQHVFAIEKFLQNYQPANVHPYVPAGAALLILSSVDGTNLPSWLYTDIQLPQVATEECGTIQVDTCLSNFSQSAVFPIYGTRGQSLLQLAQGQTYSASQGGQGYFMMVLPILPDALASNMVSTTGLSGKNWPLLPGVAS
jgi:hypothetical protein